MKEIIYKRKGIKSSILWEKTYYCKDIIDGSRNLRGEKTGKWEGVAFLYRFLILQGKQNICQKCGLTKNRFLIEPLCETFEGKTEEEMVGSLKMLIENKEEWVLRDKHWKDADFFPEEVNNKLKEFNLEKYVK